jgi:hypothetical protein
VIIAAPSGPDTVRDSDRPAPGGQPSLRDDRPHPARRGARPRRDRPEGQPRAVRAAAVRCAASWRRKEYQVSRLRRGRHPSAVDRAGSGVALPWDDRVVPACWAPWWVGTTAALTEMESPGPDSIQPTTGGQRHSSLKFRWSGFDEYYYAAEL